MNYKTCFVFEQLAGTSKGSDKNRVSGRIRASDLRHLMLLLPFLLHNLFLEEVTEYNRKHPGVPALIDPSFAIVEVNLQLLDWYHLLRRQFPPKDTEDLLKLRSFGHRYISYKTYTYSIYVLQF